MEQSESPKTLSKDSRLRLILLHYIAPGVLLIATVFTTFLAGNLLTDETVMNTQHGIISFFWKGLPFGGSILVIMGAHAFGHYLTARHHHVPAFFPYFVPQLGITGTGGAYTKLSWPIVNRQTLLNIFTIGPIAGFCASWICFIIGLLLSDIADAVPSESSISLGNSLITYLTERAIYGKLLDTQDVVLHPIGFAGWIGLHYNVWHLFPIGKLDGGRIIYALWGYRITKWVSSVSIVILIMLAYFWRGWIGMALFGMLCMIRLRQQYAAEKYTDEIAPISYYLSWGTFIILLLSFDPNPVTFQGL
jgi:membrane-associated protease RseP (regulator of RpoE activity)